MSSDTKIIKPGKPNWFEFDEMRIRLSDVQCWNWNEEKCVIKVWLRQREIAFILSCDRTQMLAFEKATKYL